MFIKNKILRYLLLTFVVNFIDSTGRIFELIRYRNLL